MVKVCSLSGPKVDGNLICGLEYLLIKDQWLNLLIDLVDTPGSLNIVKGYPEFCRIDFLESLVQPFLAVKVLLASISKVGTLSCAEDRATTNIHSLVFIRNHIHSILVDISRFSDNHRLEFIELEHVFIQ